LAQYLQHYVNAALIWTKFMITGIDLSDKNGKVNWNLLGRAGVEFAYLKASEALDIVDSAFEENRRNARERNMLAGAYHWLHPGLHVGQQADLFLDVVRTFKGMLKPVVCLEIHQAPKEEAEKNIRAFLSILERRSGVKPMIYTSDAYWKTYLPEAGWGCDYPLWLDKPGTIWPPQIWPWAGWTVWQHSYQAQLPGVPAKLGLNWFNGSREELEALVVH
jgi:lysozyme